jgi:hypothetical protein
MPRWIPALLLALSYGSPSVAAECGDYTNHPPVIGEFDFTESFVMNSIALGPDLGYVSGSSGVRILDLSDPSAPIVLGSVDTPNPACDATRLFVRGNLLFGTHPNYNRGGFGIIDVTNPMNPQSRGDSWLRDVSFQDFVIVDHFAIVLSLWTNLGPRHLRVIDFSDLDQPAIVDSLELPTRVSCLAGYGAQLFTGDSEGTVSVYDASAVPAIAPLGSIKLDAEIAVLAAGPGVVYVHTYDGGLVTVDVSDPSAPVEVDRLNGYVFSRRKLIAEGNLLVGLGEGIWTFDITAPLAPVPAGTVGRTTSGSLRHMAANAELGVCAGSYDGELMIVDASTPVPHPPVTGGPGTGPIEYIQVKGQTAYALTDTILQAFDLSSPFDPQLLDTASLPAFGMRMAIGGDLACVVSRDTSEPDSYPLTASLFQVTDPGSITSRGSVQISPYGSVLDVDVEGAIFYVTTFETIDGEAYLHVIDATAPDSPVLANSIYLNFWIGFEGSVWRGPTLDIVGDRMFLGTYRGFEVRDLSNPTDPVQTHLWEHWYHHSSDVVAVGNRLYVSIHTLYEWYAGPPPPSVDLDPGLYVFDISSPDTPVFLSLLETPAPPRELQIIGDHAYMNVDGHGTTFVGVSDPSALDPRGYWLRAEPTPFAVGPNALYAGVSLPPYLLVAPWPCGATPVGTLPAPGPPVGSSSIVARPNPFLGSTALSCALIRDSEVRIEIFDARGRNIRQLHRGRMGVGEHPITWDGCDQSGTAVASGVYFARLTTERDQATARVVRIR